MRLVATLGITPSGGGGISVRFARWVPTERREAWVQFAGATDAGGQGRAMGFVERDA